MRSAKNCIPEITTCNVTVVTRIGKQIGSVRGGQNERLGFSDYSCGRTCRLLKVACTEGRTVVATGVQFLRSTKVGGS